MIFFLFFFCFIFFFFFFFFFFNDTATTEIYTLSLHDALPICGEADRLAVGGGARGQPADVFGVACHRSEEHTSELQSQSNLVCRLLLEKKKIVAAADPRAEATQRYAADFGTPIYDKVDFFFKDPATTEIYTLSLHDALPIRACH